jgi:hypothetical protein
VLNPDGTAAAGANVGVLNAAGQVVASGVTDTQGNLLGLTVVTTEYQWAGDNTSPVTTTSFGPFTVVVIQAGSTETFTLDTLTGDTNETIRLT